MQDEKKLSVYIAASFRNLHAVHLLSAALQEMGYDILDWTEKGKPPENLNAAKRREWMDTDHGGEIFSFCANASHNADILIYLGASGQDAGIEVGMAYASGVPILGIRGPLEPLGLMLHGAATMWVDSITNALTIMQSLMDKAQKSKKPLGKEAIQALLKAYALPIQQQ